MVGTDAVLVDLFEKGSDAPVDRREVRQNLVTQPLSDFIDEGAQDENFITVSSVAGGGKEALPWYMSLVTKAADDLGGSLTHAHIAHT